MEEQGEVRGEKKKKLKQSIHKNDNGKETGKYEEAERRKLEK